MTPDYLPSLQPAVPVIAPDQSVATCLWLAQLRRWLMQGPPRGTVTLTTRTTLRLGMN